MKILKAFYKTPLHIQLAALVSIFVFILNEFVFKNYSEIFKGAETIRLVVNSLCLSITSGYVFYAIVNQNKDNSNFENIKDALEKSLSTIIHSSSEIQNHYMRVEELYVENIPLSKQEVNKLLQGIQETIKFPEISHGYPNRQNITWFELAQSNKMEIITEINKIFRYSYILDSELIKILTQLENSEWFTAIEQTKMFGKDFKQFTLFSNHYYTFSQISFELLKYCSNQKLINENPETLTLIKKIVTGKITKTEIQNAQN